MTDLINENPVLPKPHSLFKKGGAIFLILLILMMLTGGAGYLYLRWMTFNVFFTNNINKLQYESRRHQESIDTLQKAIISLEQTIQQSEANVLKQAQIIQGVQKGHFDRWRAVEAAYLVRLANDHLQFTHYLPMVIAILQRAEEVLQQADDTALLNIRQSITADIARFKKIPFVNVTILYQQLTTLNDQLDQLPLPVLHMTTNNASDSMPRPVLSWWQAGLYQSLAIFKKIVIVHHQGEGIAPLILPQEKMFLYQNLHAQMDNVIWSVMYNQPMIYQASLGRLITWIQRYFDPSSLQTRSILSVLQHLQSQDIHSSLENLDATLQQFDQYFTSQNTLMKKNLSKQEAVVLPIEPVRT